MKNQQQQKGKGVGGGRRRGDGKNFRRIRVKRGNKRSHFCMFLDPSDSASSSVGSSFAAGPSDHQNPTTKNNNNNPQLQLVDGFLINPERPNIRTRIRTITTMTNNPQLLQQVGFQINQERPILRTTTTAAAATTTKAAVPSGQQQYYRPSATSTSMPSENDAQSSSGSSISTFDHNDDYVKQRIIWDREWERFRDRPGY